MKSFLICVFLVFGLVACASAQRREGLKSPNEIQSLYKKGSVIVIVAHPLCHFSNNAFQDISPETKAQLKNAIIVAPISLKHFEAERAAVDKWNESSDLKMIKIDSNELLSDLDLKSTPLFYFFDNGVLTKKISGWPSDKSNAVLLDAAITKQLKSQK